MEDSVGKEPPKLIEMVDRFDEFGFAVFKGRARDCDERHHVYRKIELNDHQYAAWQDMLTHWSHTQLHAPERLRAYLKKGLPPRLRPQLWRNILGCKQLQEASTFNYKDHLDILRLQLVDLQISEYTLEGAHQEMWSENARTPDEETCLRIGRKTLPLHTLRQIIVDVDRTFATNQLFMIGSSESMEGKASLFRVLCIYALYNPEVGYCQGMSYLCGMLLMHMKDEEEGFWSMVALFEKPKYLMGYFDDSLTKIQEHALVFQKLLHQRMRRLDKHLTLSQVNPLVFVTPWFMCLYTSFPCWDTVLAIWDLILLDGISTIFRVALAVLYLSQKELLESEDVAHLMPRLLRPPLECMLFDTLMPMVWKISVEKWEIDSLQDIVTEEKWKKQCLKRFRKGDTVLTAAPQPSKRACKNIVGNNHENNDVDPASSSIFKRVISMLNPLSQRPLQDASNHPKQSEDRESNVLQGGKVNQPPNVKLNEPRRRPRVPGGAKPLTTTSGRIQKTYSSRAVSVEGTSDLLCPSVGEYYQGVYSAGHGIVGHPFETGQSSLGCPSEPIVGFSINQPGRSPSVTIEDDQVSPCTMATDSSLAEPKIPSSLIACEKGTTSQVQMSRKSNQQPSRLFHGQGSQQHTLLTPHAASLSYRRNFHGCGNPLNVPTNRKLIGASAKLQHSFKTFHNPAPLRKSQRLRLSSSPSPSSPEVELQYFGGKSLINTAADQM